MPDLERRLTEALDGLGERPDPAGVLERVQRRKRHHRVMRRVRTATLVVVVLAGAAGGMYGLARAFGVGAYAPVPAAPTVSPRPAPSSTVRPSPTAGSPSSSPGRSPSPRVSPSTSPGASASPSPRATPGSSPSASATPAVPLCSDQAATVVPASQEGAAGTIRTVWRATNTAGTACRSFGYPGMDFHAATGWLNVQVHRGGFADINGTPVSLVLSPGQSLYFVSYWSDVTTGGPCVSFDQVKVTLPDNFVSAVVTSSGCLDPQSVDVGPVSATPPP